MKRRAALVALALLAFAGPALATAPAKRVYLTVTATAYNSTTTQTDADPKVGAWGDRLDEVKGARVIAVSPDLLKKGLARGVRVKIRGYKGEFAVLDKMPARWKNRIDLYMGKDIRAARRFGRRRVTLSFESPAPARSGTRAPPSPCPPSPATRCSARTRRGSPGPA